MSLHSTDLILICVCVCVCVCVFKNEISWMQGNLIKLQYIIKKQQKNVTFTFMHLADAFLRAWAVVL